MDDSGVPKFAASSKHYLHINVTANKAGNIAMGESNELVVCDLDMQPHFRDAHPPDGNGRIPKCQSPLEWTTKGVKMDEMPL